MSAGPSDDAVAAGRLVRSLFMRAAWFLATLVGAVVLLQLLLWAAPGDPIDLLPNGEELRPRLEQEWGLDKPLPVRVSSSVAKALTGDLGTSLSVRPGASVSELVSSRVSRSLGILLPALLLGLALALPLARLTAGRGAVARRAVEVASVAPVFLVAYLTVHGLNELTFGLMESGWISRPGWFALPDQPSALRTAIAVTVLAVASSSLAELHGSLESEVRHIRQSGYFEAAVARGAPTRTLELVNLLAPLASLAASRVTFLVGGLVIIEKVLLINGAGALLWDACLQRDYNVAMGITLYAALAVCGARLLADVARVLIDPRMRASS